MLHRLSPRLYKALRQLGNNDHNHLLAKLLILQNNSRKIARLKDAEFKVYSQFGDDGIIQYLINTIKFDKAEEKFIEIGTEDYLESNIRFLLINNNWSGLVVDADKNNIEFIKKDDIYWKHDLTAVQAFVTRDNINKIIKDSSYVGKIGLLSIDIDGNDYWILNAIDIVDPVIIVVEYNGLFGFKHALTIPYQANFTRYNSHYSGLFWGCSLKALDVLSRKKGYKFIGTNSAGNNAYFVKKERMVHLKPVSLSKGYTLPKYREARDKKGSLTFASGDKRLHLIRQKKLYDIMANKKVEIKGLFDVQV
jgi:hypothetical protein